MGRQAEINTSVTGMPHGLLSPTIVCCAAIHLGPPSAHRAPPIPCYPTAPPLQEELGH
jgi:hypothetical protein